MNKEYIRNWIENPEKKKEVDKSVAVSILRMTQTEGWLNVRKWIENQIEMMRERIEMSSDVGDIKIENIGTNKKNKIALFCIETNYYKHSIQAYRKLLSYIDNMVKLTDGENI